MDYRILAAGVVLMAVLCCFDLEAVAWAVGAVLAVLGYWRKSAD